MSHDEPEDQGGPPEKEDYFVDMDQQEDMGFRAFVLHNTRLESMLNIWKSLLEMHLDDEDQLILDEIRQQIKVLLADQTHDRYLKAVSVTCAARICGIEE